MRRKKLAELRTRKVSRHEFAAATLKTLLEVAREVRTSSGAQVWAIMASPDILAQICESMGWEYNTIGKDTRDLKPGVGEEVVVEEKKIVLARG